MIYCKKSINTIYFFNFFNSSVTDDCGSKKSSNKDSPDVFTLQLNSLLRGVGGGSSIKDSFLNNNNNKDSSTNDAKGPQQFDAKCYIENGKINFGKLITDEVLAADHKLVETAKKTVCMKNVYLFEFVLIKLLIFFTIDQYSRYHSFNCYYPRRPLNSR